MCTRMVLVTAALCLSILSARGAADKSSSPFRPVDRTETSWTYEYAPSLLLPQHIIIDGVPHRLYNGIETGDNAGSPLLPTEAITFGVPFNFTITAELADATYAEEQGVLVAPSATYARSEEGEAIPSYVKNSDAYRQNRLFPSSAIQIEDPYTIRYSRMATLRLSPIQYNPATKILKRLVRARLVVRLQPLAISKAAPVPVTARDPHFEPEYRSLMANYGDATAWRYRTPPSVEADSTGTWFAAGDAFIRLPVAQDGWYRVTLSDLAGFGVAPPALDTSTVKVYFKGQQVPLYTGADMSMHFYGLRKRGDSTYLDYYTDTSAYWLTWQKPGAGLRYNAVPDLNITPADTEFASHSSVHLEENKDYYEGTGDAEVTLNGQAAGEGWTWDYFYPGTTLEYNFALDNVSTSGDSTATLRVRLFSTTRNYSTPDHIARFWVNDSLLGEKSFQGRTQGLFLASFPRAWLKEGANKLKIQSVTTASSPNQFYLDWFEVEYVRTHVAQNGRLLCSISPSAGQTEARVSARGFSSATIHVLDLTSGRKLQDISVTMEAGGTYAVVFDDTLTLARQYLIVEDVSAIPVTGASRKTFPGLRQNTSGADYIILTHGLFRSAANTLAAHRESRNGVRTAVVDVQDIYDEFNFGHLSSECIKIFLRHAFDNWPSPAPAYVLMFGDASWDFHRYMATTVMTNFVPAYGVPAGDNWYVCYDSIRTFLPSLKIGRLPVQSPAQAETVVEKVIGYDSYTLADWNKNFLFISGGTTPSEKLSFDGQSNAMIQDIVLPAPIGGTPFRVYKVTQNTIDGENKQLMRDLVRDGLVFVNFLGHSGGRIWGVDIGTPADLENTNGMLPFVTSVSCNVAAFAEPSGNVLSEDFVLAEHRGAVAMWASSSLGYANVGAMLVRNFLESVRDDTARVLSETVVSSLIKMWQSRGGDFVTLASMNLNPLLGDPLTALAIPRKPDLAITQPDLELDVSAPTPMDTTVHVKMAVHNYGLVPADSVEFSMVDVSASGLDSVASAMRIRPTLHRDTILVPWSGTSVKGSHLLQVTIDPVYLIDEVTKTNNAASLATYVYAHSILAVRPLNNEAVSAGAVELVVTSPVSGDTGVTAFEFELDTSAAFTSVAHVSSGQILSGPVGGRWTTPGLSTPGAYFWRARTIVDTLVGKWMVGRFLIDTGIPSKPFVSWRESSAGQFSGGHHNGTSNTDSGVTLRASPSLFIGARSLGNRAIAEKEYYSTIWVNEQSVKGYWWENGSSFMVVRLNAFTGAFEFKGFNVSGNAALSDSMKSFIDGTSLGDYLLFSVIFDGYSNVSEALRASIRSLGSTKIDSVLPGHSWMLIARKQASPPYFTLEKWSPDGEAADSTIIPNNYAVGNGVYTSIRNPFPSAFEKLRWTPQLTAGVHTLRAVVLGVKPHGGVDSLASITSAETEKDLSGLTPAFADSLYTHIGIAATFGTNDALTTPTLREWSMDFAPPPDLAISGRTVGARVQTLAKGTAIQIPLTIHNIGYQPADSVRIRVDLIGSGGQAQPIHYATAGAIPVDSSSTINLSIPSDGLTGYNLLDVVVSPPARARDLLAENNHAQVLINFTGTGETLAATVRMYADGVALMDGDYVSSRPQFLVQFEDLVGITPGQERVRLWADNQLVESQAKTGVESIAGWPGAGSDVVSNGQSAQVNGGPGTAAPATASTTGAGAGISSGTIATADGFIFTPQLSNGPHEIVVRLYRVDSLAGLDSLERRIALQVVGDLRIMRVYNYPNPFSSSTEFTFVLSGARPPDGLTIRIFTITGRRIQEIFVPPTDLRVGFNRIWWDGRDRDGDEIANGYYFYKIQVEGEGKVETAIEKMAKVR